MTAGRLPQHRPPRSAPCGQDRPAPAGRRAERPPRRRGARAGALLAVLLSGLLGPAASPVKLPPPPPKTDKGSYQGTWFFVDRYAKIAFWLDETEDGLKARYRYAMKQNRYGDSGETGTGPSNSPYGPGTLTLTARLDDDGVIRGRMIRTWGQTELQVTESNSYEAYRIIPGDRLYVRFTNIVAETVDHGQKSVSDGKEYAFTFAKVTDELVFWEELSF